MGRTVSPLGAIARGAIAGAIGTLAMDLVWYARYRRGGGDQAFQEWEFSAPADDWEKAPAPAQIARRVYRAALKRDLPADRIPLANNVTHWWYGSAGGELFGILVGSLPGTSPAAGLAWGAILWATSYALLAPAGIYRPIWEYDAQTLWKDLSAHLAYGLALGAAFRALRGS